MYGKLIIFVRLSQVYDKFVMIFRFSFSDLHYASGRGSAAGNVKVNRLPFPGSLFTCSSP